MGCQAVGSDSSLNIADVKIKHKSSASLCQLLHTNIAYTNYAQTTAVCTDIWTNFQTTSHPYRQRWSQGPDTFAFVCLVELHDLTFSLNLLLMLKAARVHSFSDIS